MLRTIARNFTATRRAPQKSQGLDYLLENMEPLQTRSSAQNPSEYLPASSFRTGHSYYPSSFGHTPAQFFKKPSAPEGVKLPDLNRLSLSPNAMSVFLTSMGKIQSRRKTGLSWKEQRKLGKAVRRARQSGLLNTFAVGSNRKL
ncbi:hypothetical protein WALSEDRAFT_65698 [Wallemia mellicola CBS 633.66]|uniref:Small ribosomal subunit protein bS18m n=1 Tax=Wallemia mellicola (strain ATCC MYA-4683 / CBS 633.66) TaxID=671144 RepID=I4Y825_WALMC|nr:hypothetical protein WALSEDRAFT_65698 [Wallemia mellicola CBS 633.66]EIM20117.1 hypothetical protein WALSEDRAFT_65698 [Wallemia mellicola CBS 633.66]|eukprot:XP_006959838.1 hypothetical protein WALSEDRAFT_65698 [Wallemia mellicola CBS 633.66]